MRLLLLCDRGAEAACAAEAQARLKVVRKGTGFVIADAPDRKAAVQTIYFGQTLLDGLLYLGEGKDPEKLIGSVDFDEPELQAILHDANSFSARARHVLENDGDHELNEEIGAALKERIGKKVDLEKPELVFVPFRSEGVILLGLSLTGRELRKRDYRVFTSNKSLRSTVAASVLRLSGFTGEERLLLAAEDDGTLAIEAAMMGGLSPFRYNKEFLFLKYWPEAKEWLVDTEPRKRIPAVVPTVPFLKAVQKNAKIAGVHKLIEVTKAEIDWIDTKFDEKSIDIIIAFLACSGRHRPVKEATKLADDLAYQSRYVLAEGGSVNILTLKPDEHAPPFVKHGYVEAERRGIWMGEQKLSLLTFKKK